MAKTRTVLSLYMHINKWPLGGIFFCLVLLLALYVGFLFHTFIFFHCLYLFFIVSKQVFILWVQSISQNLCFAFNLVFYCVGFVFFPLSYHHCVFCKLHSPASPIYSSGVCFDVDVQPHGRGGGSIGSEGTQTLEPG